MIEGKSCNHNLQGLYDVDYKSDKAKQLLSDIEIDERLRKGVAGKLYYAVKENLQNILLFVMMCGGILC